MIYYVDCKASLCGDGRKERPFRSIQEAADIALPGDEVLVEPGVYFRGMRFWWSRGFTANMCVRGMPAGRMRG